jgi:proteasome lid subunit RPN8/RPN11
LIVRLTDEIKVAQGVNLQVAESARQSFPNECCGVLVARDGVVLQAVPLPNLSAPRRADRYEIDPQAYQKVERDCKEDGCEIAGFFHSHPGGLPQPSETDLEMARGLFEFARLRYVYAIQVVGASQPGPLTWWRLNEDVSAFIPLRLLPA